MFNNGQIKVAETFLIPVKRIRRYEKQPRIYFDEEGLKSQAESMEAVGQREVVKVTPISGDPDHDYELIDGERRWRACLQSGKEYVEAKIEPVNNEEDQFTRSVAANASREELTPYEWAIAVKRFQEEFGKSAREIAEICGKSLPWIYQRLALLKLHPAVLELMHPQILEDDRLNVSEALMLARLPLDHQEIVAGRIVKQGLGIKESRNCIRDYARQLGLQMNFPGGKGRTPREDYRNLSSFVKRLHNELNLWLERRVVIYAEIFCRRDPQDQKQLVEWLRGAAERLQRLATTIEGAY